MSVWRCVPRAGPQTHCRRRRSAAEADGEPRLRAACALHFLQIPLTGQGGQAAAGEDLLDHRRILAKRYGGSGGHIGGSTVRIVESEDLIVLDETANARNNENWQWQSDWIGRAHVLTHVHNAH